MILGLEAYAPQYLNTRGYSSLLEAFGAEKSDYDQELLVQANATLMELEGESMAIYKVLRERYAVRFPELATFELSSVQYARVALLLSGEDPEMPTVDGNFTGALDTSKITTSNTGLPNATVMIISVTAATTNGRPFTIEEWKSTREVANILVGMEKVRRSILKFIESRMERLAPNVTALVGVEVASKLVGAAGGIMQLSRIPAGNIQVIGSGGRKHLAGLSSASVGLHSGFIAEAPLVAEVAPEYKKQAQRLLSAKVSIASRVDAGGDHADGNFGRKLYDEIVGKLDKLSEPAPLKTVKPLPIPDSERKKRRGGKRARKLKELYAQSEASKQKNRLAFGEKAEEEVFVGDRMEGLGMLGSGNLRTLSGSSERDTRLREHLKKQVQGKLATTGSSGMRSASTAATASASASASVLNDDSITLVNKSAPVHANNNNSKYFNLNSGFKRNKD